MQNQNYNLVKLLHGKLDDHWRITRHYLNDAEGLDCKCREILEEMMKDDEKHIKMLKEEITRHMEKKKFD